MSILPIVDEFVFALGKSDNDDTARAEIESIKSPKIRIIDTVWDIEKYPRGMEHAHQTDIAKSHCFGDWLFYIQADEVIHEKYLDPIVKRCEALMNDREIEGLLFDYVHFWGDYGHYQKSHGWYPKEIRIVRNDPEIHSWESAQSFRRIPSFDGINYRQQEGTYKLKVASANASVYHYGWVRPPRYMNAKKKAIEVIHQGAEKVARLEKETNLLKIDYGPLDKVATFKGTHPLCMKEWIARFDWQNELQMSGKPSKNRLMHKHEKLQYRILTFIEQNLLGGRQLGGFRNYRIVRK